MFFGRYGWTIQSRFELWGRPQKAPKPAPPIDSFFDRDSSQFLSNTAPQAILQQFDGSVGHRLNRSEARTPLGEAIRRDVSMFRRQDRGRQNELRTGASGEHRSTTQHTNFCRSCSPLSGDVQNSTSTHCVRLTNILKDVLRATFSAGGGGCVRCGRCERCEGRERGGSNAPHR